METFYNIIDSDKPTLVDFFATWCGPCKTMHPILEELKREMEEDLRIIKIDIDKNQALASSYNIQSVPTLCLFIKGNCIWRKSGAMPLNMLKQEIMDASVHFRQ